MQRFACTPRFVGDPFSAMLAILCLSTGLVPQPPLKPNSRRAALVAGGSAAAAVLLPTRVWADAIDDIAARANAKALDEKFNKDEINKEAENQQIAFACFVALIVFLGPITGIQGAQVAIRKAAEGSGDDALKASLKSNDPPIFGRKQPPPPAEPPKKKGFFGR